MNTTHIPTLKEMAEFVSGTTILEFRCADRDEAYSYIQRVAVETRYMSLGRSGKGIIRAYCQAVTGYSPAQLSRLLGQYRRTGRIKAAVRSQPKFQTIYTPEDITELARIDEAHEGLSGPATVAILKREYLRFGNPACSRLRHLSVSHLYNLRATSSYRRSRATYTKTKPANVAIGTRAKPRTDGRPGHIRVDSVHQGDKDGEKGVYHINLVDEITQMEVVIAVEGISERFMLPALTAALETFPLTVLGFHADNGSEYINQQVAGLLECLSVKLTKSRPRHSGDNGLVETKNGAVIRKALGYAHIPRTADNVKRVNDWYGRWFVPYLNFHRPCAFRVTRTDDRGRRIHRYPKEGYMTPYEKLKSLPRAEKYLKSGVDFASLDRLAYAKSDTDWASSMQEAKTKLWQSLQL